MSYGIATATVFVIIAGWLAVLWLIDIGSRRFWRWRRRRGTR